MSGSRSSGLTAGIAAAAVGFIGLWQFRRATAKRETGQSQRAGGGGRGGGGGGGTSAAAPAVAVVTDAVPVTGTGRRLPLAKALSATVLDNRGDDRAACTTPQAVRRLLAAAGTRDDDKAADAESAPALAPPSPASSAASSSSPPSPSALRSPQGGDESGGADDDDDDDASSSPRRLLWPWPAVHEGNPARGADERVATKCRVGQRVLVRRSQHPGSRGTVRFVGRIPWVRPGVWVGVELDADAGPGKNSGDARGRRVFECTRPGQGIFCLEDAVECEDAPVDACEAAARLAGRWVGECVSCASPPPMMAAAAAAGAAVTAARGQKEEGEDKEGELQQQGPGSTTRASPHETPYGAGAVWMAFQGAGDDYGPCFAFDDVESPHSVAGDGPWLRCFADGRLCGAGEWSLALREHHFLRRLVITCASVPVRVPVLRRGDAKYGDGDEAGERTPRADAAADVSAAETATSTTTTTTTTTTTNVSFALSFLDDDRIELRYAATPAAFEAGEGLVVVRLRRVPPAHPVGGFSSRERAALCIDELGRYWEHQAKALQRRQRREVKRQQRPLLLPREDGNGNGNANGNGNGNGNGHAASPESRVGGGDDVVALQRAVRRRQRREILRETGRIYFRHGLEPFAPAYLERMGLQGDKDLRVLLDQALGSWGALVEQLFRAPHASNESGDGGAGGDGHDGGDGDGGDCDGGDGDGDGDGEVATDAVAAAIAAVVAAATAPTVAVATTQSP